MFHPKINKFCKHKNISSIMYFRLYWRRVGRQLLPRFTYHPIWKQEVYQTGLATLKKVPSLSFRLVQFRDLKPDKKEGTLLTVTLPRLKTSISQTSCYSCLPAANVYRGYREFLGRLGSRDSNQLSVVKFLSKFAIIIWFGLERGCS